MMNTYGTSAANRSNMFCGINKTADGSRTGEKGDAHRDVTMARVGETYLVKAECQVRNCCANVLNGKPVKTVNIM